MVGVKDRQAQYLACQGEGGTRAPARQALRLPSVVDRNESGNLPAGLIRQLVARAGAGRRAPGRQSPAHHAPRFDFHAEAQRITELEFEALLARAGAQV